MRALSIAATGMLAQQTNVEVIANNLANMNTTGYKQQRAEFQDLLYQNVEQPGAQTSDSGTLLPSGIQLGAGVRTAAIYRINSQGDLNNTGNPYDLAINGAGYFHITMPDGTDAYTRAGNFALSPEGQIVTDKGYVVAPGIAVPQNATRSRSTRRARCRRRSPARPRRRRSASSNSTRFPNEGGSERRRRQSLSPRRRLRVRRSPAFRARPATARSSRAFSKTSNVNAVEEITSLITAQRAYEMNSKVITAADEMLQTTSRLAGA